jgi:hypothetical protein
MQSPLVVAARLPEAGIEVLRSHFGLASPVLRCADEEGTFAAVETGRAALVALPAGGRWWRTHHPSRLFVTARLPFFGDAAATVFLLSSAPPDASGPDAARDDRTLVRVPSHAEAALADAGLTPTVLLRDDEFALIELPGMIAAGDKRLAALGATVLGAYATPLAA